MNKRHFLNGKFVSEEDLLISPRDLGFTRGYAVFDFFRTYRDHRPFMLDRHIDRLFNSANKIDLSIPWPKDQIKEWIFKTISLSKFKGELVVRIIISGGISNSLEPAEFPSIVIIVDEAIIFPESTYLQGIKVITAEYQRYNADSKTTHYIEAIRKMKIANDEDAEEILYHSNGLILEGAFSNFFAVIDNKLVTSKSGILEGITRQILLENLKLDIPISVENFSIEKLCDASEAFLSVSGKGIIPVVKIDNQEVGNGKVGNVTKEVLKQFADFIKSDKW